VFFRQERVGLNGQRFKMVKFRSMVTTAEQDLAALKDLNEAAGLLFKLKNDPRITTCGRWLRKYSLDELPQFWNVLKGDMSLVGPRPQLPDEVEGYEGLGPLLRGELVTDRRHLDPVANAQCHSSSGGGVLNELTNAGTGPASNGKATKHNGSQNWVCPGSV